MTAYATRTRLKASIVGRTAITTRWAWLVIVALAACKTERPKAHAESPARVASITTEPCYGSCPVYSATVFSDGAVDYDGREFVGQIGARTTQLSVLELTDLMQRFESSGFDGWRSSYDEYDSTDHSTITISFRGKTIHHYLGDSSAPPELKQLERDVPRLMRIAPFIKDFDSSIQ